MVCADVGNRRFLRYKACKQRKARLEDEFFFIHGTLPKQNRRKTLFDNPNKTHTKTVCVLLLFLFFDRLVRFLVDEGEQLVYINSMDHTGLFHGLTAAGRSAQAVHADGKKDRRGLRSDVENVTDDGVAFDLDHVFYLRA